MRIALENDVSVASVLLLAEATLTEKLEEKTKEAVPAHEAYDEWLAGCRGWESARTKWRNAMDIDGRDMQQANGPRI